MNAVLERLLRSTGAILLPQLVAFAPAVVEILPQPYPLVLTPILMGISKGLRDGFPGKPWLRWLPF